MSFSRWLRGFAVLACWFSLGSVLAQSGYVQIRSLYPPDGTGFSASLALDAYLRLPLGDSLLQLKLTETTLRRQHLGVQFSSGAALLDLLLRREPDEAPDSERLRLGINGRYAAPEGFGLLSGVSLRYALDTSSGRRALPSLDAAANGDFAPQWRWDLEYRLEVPVIPGLTGLDQRLSTWVRTSVLEPFELGVGAGLVARAGRVAATGSLELGWRVTGYETLGLRGTLSTEPGDAEELFLETTRFEPWQLGLRLGRSSESPLTWGVSWTAATGVALEYDGSLGDRAAHRLTLGVAIEATEALSFSARGGLRAEFDTISGLWYARLSASLLARVSAPGFSLEASGEALYGPDVSSGNLRLEASWLLAPFVLLVNVDLRLTTVLRGRASLQGLYFFLPGWALNLTVFYRAQADWQGGSGFGVGFGLLSGF